jgi:hypothetical protein
MLSVGFVLSQPEPHRVWAISICGFPSKGLFLFPGRPPRRFALTLEGITASNYGAARGQGGLETRYLDPEATEPSLFAGDLSGGFLAKSPHRIEAAELACSVHLEYSSVWPFIISPEAEAEDLAKGDTTDLQRFARYEFQPETWYPVELSPPGWEGPGELMVRETPGYSFGVFKLSAASAPGGRAAVLRYVYEVPYWNPALERFTLFRYGRRVGEAERCDSKV